MALFGNKVTEKDLRTYLSNNGYDGQSATFQRLELVGIQRPGWLQLFAFEVLATKTGLDDRRQLYGLCLDDERSKQFEVLLETDDGVRDSQLQKWSRNMIVLRNGSDFPATLVYLFGFVILGVVTAMIAVQFCGT